MERFVDDDAGYRDWLARHPDGFVINTGRTPTAAYLMLHRAACGSISGTPARGSTFTGDYAKVCGGREELEGFGRQLGGEAKPCGLCLNQAAQSLRRAPGGGKYGPLRDHLAGCAGSRVRLTFAEVEELVGRLPDSAHQHRAWWGNNGSNVEAQAWRDAGWHVESVNQAGGEVIFARGIAGQGRSDRRPAAGPPGPYIDAQVSASMVTRAEALGLDTGKLVRLVAELNDNYSRGTPTLPMRCSARFLITFRRCSAAGTSRRPPAATRGAARTGVTLTGCWTSSSRQMTRSTVRSPRGLTGSASTTCPPRSG